MGESVDLLFFDTFAHESSEELNLDLVQFPKPVFVTEVRIIPLGARVQADFPGGVRLGATNPSQFSIEFFVNDLGKPGASTFESLGGFEYNQNGCINLDCLAGENACKVPTDGLVLRGWYTTITLAVYGILTTNVAERIPPPIVTPSLPPQTINLSEVKPIIAANNEIEGEWTQSNAQPVVPVNYVQQVPIPYAQPYETGEEFRPEYAEYYNNDPSKNTRMFHNTGEMNGDRDIDKYQKPLEIDHRTEPDRPPNRDRHYSRSHSQEKEPRTGRDNYRERDWDYERSQSYDRSEKDWNRDSVKHSDNYRRPYSRDERDDSRKKPRTPPATSPRRPHTPGLEHKEPGADEVKTEPIKADTDPVVAAKSPTQPAEDFQIHTEEFEPILSDEDIIDDIDHYQDSEENVRDYGGGDDTLKLFVPGVTPLQQFKDDSEFNVINGVLTIDDSWKAFLGIVDDFLKSSITVYNCSTFERLNKEIKEEFIHLCEKLMATIDGRTQFPKLVDFFVVVREIKVHATENTESVEQIHFFIETVVEWMKIALNFHFANTQIQPAYKIRHVKCGVRLVEWSSSSAFFTNLLAERQLYVDRELLTLYNQKYMALSIRLMILRALDAYLADRNVIEHFVAGKNLEESGYKILINMLIKNPLVRLKFALQSLIKKLNLYEILRKFVECVGKLDDTITPEDEKKQILFIIKTLEYTLQTLDRGSFVLSQPKRFLPVRAQFEIDYSDTGDIINFLKIHKILQCFCILLTYRSTMNLPNVRISVCKILAHIANSKSGMEFLAAYLDDVNILLQCLLPNEDDVQYSLSDTLEANSHYLGLKTAYKIQCLYHTKQLLRLGVVHADCNHSDVIDELHSLYCLTLTNVGKMACCKVLTMGDNINCLLQFTGGLIAKDRTESQLTRMRKLPGWEYIIDLISMIVMLNADVLFLQKYALQLLELVQHKDVFETGTVKKLNELAAYLRLFENPNAFKYDNIQGLMAILNKNLDDVTTYPGELISCLRILHHLGVPKEDYRTTLMNNACDTYNELKYKHVIIQLFAHDGINLLSKFLSSICDYYEQPALHTATFVSTQGVHIVSILSPCIHLLHELLKYVIHCRNVKFKDLAPVIALLRTFNLARAFPPTAPLYFTCKRLHAQIVDILLLYTQPLSEQVNEKDSLSKTLWTLLCGEVIKFTDSTPYCAVSGLMVLTELLPLPLPVQTCQPLTADEINWSINLRKLWSAHLHAFGPHIQRFVIRMCTSSYQPLLTLLRKFCIQLADVAANSALMFARGLLDAIHAGLVGGTSDEEKACACACTDTTTRLLNFLACLITHCSIKCAVLSLLCTNTGTVAAKSDEKYPELIRAFAQVLSTTGAAATTTTTTTNYHTQAQECILSIIQSLCDTEITLLQRNGSDFNLDVYLANSLPTKDVLIAFVSMIVNHLTADTNEFITYLPIIRTLILLTEHDYGFYHLKENLVQKTCPFRIVLERIVKNISKESTECMSALNSLLEFFRVCRDDGLVVADVVKPRLIRFSVGEFKQLIGWKTEEGDANEDHAIFELEKSIREFANEDESFKDILDSINSIKEFLNNESSADVPVAEPTLPPPTSPLMQFASRMVYTSDVILDHLTSSYWLAVSADGEHDVENGVTCDLNEVSRQHLPNDVSLIKEVEKLCRVYTTNSSLTKETLTKEGNLQKAKIKKPFVTITPRRGFARSIQVRGDLFRSRPPNTSRPPSLHVDDFVALETCGAQPTGPTGYNKVSRDLVASGHTLRSSRGRNFMSNDTALHYRQMSWWCTGLSRSSY